MSTKVEEFQRKLPEFLIYQIYKNKLRIYENTKKFLKQLISKISNSSNCYAIYESKHSAGNFN